MKKILYIGNNLKNKKSNIATIRTLGTLFEKEGFKVYYASSKTNKLLRLLDMIWSCLSLFKKIDFVLIDTYSTSNFYYAFIISQICRVLKLKYIPILHGGNLPNRLNQNPKLSNYIFNYSYKNVSPSLFMMHSFNEHGFNNVIYIPNTIEVAKYSFKERSFNSINLFWLRSFSNIYNPSLAVKIFKRLKEEKYNVKLCMVGPDSDGSLEEVKQFAKEYDLEIDFPGKLEKKDWLELSKDYNVFINTTNFDNMPVSVVEAMALGLPIVSTNVGGMPFLISNKEDGLLVPPNDVSAFSKAILSVVNNATTRTKEMTLKARQKAEHFDWSIIKLKWMELLR